MKATVRRKRVTRRGAQAPASVAAAPVPAAVRGITNADVARLFGEAADLLDLCGASSFRVRAYRTAARTVEQLPESIANVADTGRLEELPGIAKDLAGKIEEILSTGSFTLLRELRSQIPRALIELLRFPGLGPKRVRKLYDALGVRSVSDLLRAARKRRIRELAGFGPRTEENILAAARAGAAEEPRWPRPVAEPYVSDLVAYLNEVDGVDRVEVAGSYRRCRDTVGDVDILVTRTDGRSVAKALAAYPAVERVLAQGPTRASVRLACGLQVDVREIAPESFGSALHYFTGSKAHNVAVRRMAQQRGLKINEYGVYRGPRRIAGRSEEEVLRTVGLPSIPPELREDRGELAAAAAGMLPDLITRDDIRGDLQVHTTDSDGRDSLEAMAEAAEAMGYEYLAVTDHSPRVRVVGGLDAAGFRRQMRRIARLNARLRHLTILKGAEVDILPDGSLDLDDDTLEALDVVVVSIHSDFMLPRARQTDRLVRALQHRAVDILAHPTGRLIGKRTPIDVDLGAVFRVARERGIAVEINAQPQRLELTDVQAREALDLGVRLAIDTDAHSTRELQFMRWGVDQARRAWAEPDGVINTRSLRDVRRLLHAERG